MYNEDLEKQELKEEKKDENRRRYFLFIFLFLIVLFVGTFGITVSYYKTKPTKPLPNGLACKPVNFVIK